MTNAPWRMARFQILRPFWKTGCRSRMAREQNVILRTARRWVRRYRREGLAGLAPKNVTTELSETFPPTSSNLSKDWPSPSRACPWRRSIAKWWRPPRSGENLPRLSRCLQRDRRAGTGPADPGPRGLQAYSDPFDLVYRREAEAPNAIWQADHSELDIWMLARTERPKALADDHPRRLQPRRRRLVPLLSGSLSDSDCAGLPPGDLAEGAASLACLRHPPDSLYRPRQRFHLPAPRAGGG